MLSKKDYEEKRDFIRMRVNTSMYFTIEGGKERYEGRCLNISGAGMLFETDKKLTPGQQLQITIPATHKKIDQLDATVEVIRSDPNPNQHKFEIGVVIKQIKP